MAPRKSKDDETPEETTETVVIDVSDIPEDRPDSVELRNCIENAAQGLEEKAEVLARIQSARQLSTLLIQNGSGSREQVAWVRQFLPRKKRKVNGEDVDVTDEADE
jgi:hypothetical protein